MKPNKLSSRLLALALSLVLSLSLSLPALAAWEDGIIYIHTAKDLCALSDSCAYDAWSRGKTVLLTADISLRGVDFEPIASFSGTFNGGGHTISGLTLTDSLSPAGLFLTLERGAFVHALKVEGQVTPGGTKEAVGGIVGRNYGTLEECSFFGVVKGDSAVGGIAGRNEEGGLIANCTASGSISANRYTGGIAGYNLGTLRACINSAAVNTSNVDPTLSLDDLSIDPASSLTDLVSVGAVESRNATSDTGGIAGYSSGSLLSCINRGAVGYPHFGYNVGGGAGRNDGFVDSCSNYGMIYGRKDVGGIVGQMEPYLRLSLRDDLIARLRAELDKLNALVSSTLDDVDDARIGIIGICGFGGMGLNAAVMDTRIKATVASTMYDMTRVTANGYFDAMDANARYEARTQLNEQRTKDARAGTFAPAPGLPSALKGDEPQFVKDYFDYYKTKRGFHPRSINSNGAWNATSSLSFMTMPILAYASEIRNAVLLIHGEKAHSRYFSEEAFKKLTGDNKELLIIPGASHTDLYDRMNIIPFDKMESFFKTSLK